MKYFFFFFLCYINLTSGQNDFGKNSKGLSPKIEFYRGQLPFNDSNEFDTSTLINPEILKFPFAMWSEGDLKKKKAKDYGTIVLNVHLPDTNGQYYYYFDRITGGCDIYINNEYVKSFGKFDKTLKESSSKGTPLRLKLPKEKNITIALVISNSQHQWGGGINLKPRLYKEEVFIKFNKIGVIKEYSAVIILLLLIVYQVFLFFLYKEKKYPYMAAICLAFICRSIVIKNSIIYDFLPNIPFSIIQKLRYGAIYMAALSILLFYKELIPKHIHKKIFISFLCLQGVGILGCIILPTYQVTQLAAVMRFILIAQVIFIFWFIGKSIYSKEKYAKLLFISIFVVFACLINNVLHASGKINTVFIVIFLPLMYLVVQTIINHFIQIDINRQVTLLSNALESKKEENKNLKLDTLRRIREKQKIKTSLKEIPNRTSEITSILADMHKNNGEDEKSRILKSQIILDHQEFTSKLLQVHPTLTKIDVEVATFIILGKTRAEIADLRGVAMSSVKTSRNRLRKKLELSEDILLDDYLKSLL